jgi:hypothetical protein
MTTAGVGVKRALCIGVNYKGDSSELKGCINDTMNVRDILIKKYNYKPENIRMMNDECETNMKPTRVNILRELFNLVQGTTSNNNDTLFFQYSGHGSNVQDKSGDEIDKRDEVIVPLDYKTGGIIRDDELFDILVRPLKSGQKLTCLIDACNSGTVLDLQYNIRATTKQKGELKVKGKYDYNEWDTSLNIKIENGNVSNKGRVTMLSGCLDNELSNDVSIGSSHQGIMTYCFISVLKESNYNVKYKHLLKDVNCMLDVYGFKNQNSQLSMNNIPNLEEYVVL